MVPHESYQSTRPRSWMASLGKAWFTRHTHLSLNTDICSESRVCDRALRKALNREHFGSPHSIYVSILKVINQAHKLLNNGLHDDLNSNFDFLVFLAFHVGLRWCRTSCPIAYPSFHPSLGFPRASHAMCRHEPSGSKTSFDPRKSPHLGPKVGFRPSGSGRHISSNMGVK